VAVEHGTLKRWVLKYAPEVEKQVRLWQRPVGKSGRLDEPSVKIKGKGAYWYRAVDTAGPTLDFLLTSTRDRDAAETFFPTALRPHGTPEKSTIDQSGSNTAVITHYNQPPPSALGSRPAKSLNNRRSHSALTTITCGRRLTKVKSPGSHPRLFGYGRPIN
jgi:transposase-like protein